MKIKSAFLSEKLKKLAPAISVNGRMPILENVLIKDGKISATDLQLTIISSIPVKEQFLLPFKPLQNILNEVGDCEIEILQTETEITLTAGADVFSLGKSVDIENYPLQIEVDYEKEIAIGEEFFAAMRNASKHESPNEQQTVHGINIKCVAGKIEIAGTDATTIYVARFPANGIKEFSAHIDSSFCVAVADWTLAKMNFSEKFVSCRNDQYEVRIQLLETKYPDYGVYMPEEVETNCVVTRKELDAAIRKCLVFGGDIKTVKLIFKDDAIILEYSNLESYHKAVTSIAAKHSVEEEYFVGIAAELIQRTLSSLDQDTEKINFHFPEEANRPVYVQNENVLILIVPSII